MGGDLSPKTAAYTLREASWTAGDLCIPLRKHLVKTAFQLANVQDTTTYVFLSIDDNFTEKTD